MWEQVREALVGWGQAQPIVSTVGVMIAAGLLWNICVRWMPATKEDSASPNKLSANGSRNSTINQAGRDVIINPPNPSVPNVAPPRFSEKFDNIHIAVGGNSVELQNGEGTRVALFGVSSTGGIGLAGQGFANPVAGQKTTAFRDGGTIPAVAFIRDHQLFIDAEVFAGPGRPAMHIRSNELSDRPARWDRNTDNKHALEIVDENLMPVLQIVYPDEARAVIKGCLR